MSRMTALVLQMFARTVWSDDILAQTIADLILHFRLVSLKTLGTRGSRNHVTLQDKIIEELRQAKLANRTAAKVVPPSQTRFSLGKTESICEKTIEYVSILFNISIQIYIFYTDTSDFLKTVPASISRRLPSTSSTPTWTHSLLR